MLLTGLIEQDGGTTEAIYPNANRADAIVTALREIGEADLILVVGGSGEDWNDRAAAAVAAAGRLGPHGLALEPARSLGVGEVGGIPVVLLPGSPLACLCGYDCLVGPALRQLSGQSPDPAQGVREGRLTRKVVSAPGRVDYVRVAWRDGSVEPIASANGICLFGQAAADGFLLVPEASEGYPAGSDVTITLYGPRGGTGVAWVDAKAGRMAG